MKSMKKFIILLVACMTLGLNANAQKSAVGYVNTNTILEAMPEVKQLTANLEAYATQLDNKYKQLLESYQQKQQDYAAKAQNGQLSPVQEEEAYKVLGAEEEKIRKFQQESQQKLAQKQQELFAPLEERIFKIVDDIAAEMGYSYIINQGGAGGVLLYANPALDITSKVQARL
jgi:outer membrane protein